MISMTTWQLLVWTYRDQQAHHVMRSPRDWFRWVLGEMGSLDGRFPRINHDAAMVHACVAGLVEAIADALVWQAILGDRPEPVTEQPVPYPVYADRLSRHQLNDERWGWFVDGGRRVYYSILIAERTAVETPVYEQQGNRRTGRRTVQVGTVVEQIDVEYCPLRWEPDPTWVTVQNALCDAVNEAIVDVEAMLSEEGLLRDHDIVAEGHAYVGMADLVMPAPWQPDVAIYRAHPPGPPRLSWDDDTNKNRIYWVRGSCRLRQPV